MTEQVLVVPTEILRECGLFQGFSPQVDHYLSRLLDPQHLRYVSRTLAETDPTLKQLIPYVVLRCGDRIFHYRRASGGEKRLHAKRSIGIGGHICSEDGGVAENVYRKGMLRELQEEVSFSSRYNERCIGLINDDSTPVGQVHLGVVHILNLCSPYVQSREAGLVAEGFATVAELREDLAAFETWSQLLLTGEWMGDR